MGDNRLFDVALVIVVSLQATVIAYLRQPRLKAFAYVLPFPFTVATLALGRPVDATNALGLILLVVYIHGVRLLFQRAKLSIVLSIVIAALVYSIAGWLLAPLVPAGDKAFWLALAGVALLAATLYLGLPYRQEPGHRTTLPVWIKLPVIVGVILVLVAVKSMLRGFMTVFPMVGIVGAYEARHSLWTMGRQISPWIMAMVPMLAIIRLLQGRLGLAAALALGWVGFLGVLLPLTRFMWSREGS